MSTSAPAPVTQCRLDIRGMDCGDCAKTIETSLAQMPGVQSARVNFGLARAEVAFDPDKVNQSALRERIAALGYQIADPKPAAGSSRWIFDISGMDCGDCAKTIESGVGRLHGVSEATVNFGAATLSVSPGDSRLTRGAVVSAVAEAGYQARVRGETTGQIQHSWWQNRRLLETFAAVLLWVIGFGIEHAAQPRWLSAIPFLAGMAIAGYPVFRAAWFAVKARRPDMNLLMTVAAIGAIAIGEWDEGASVLTLFAVGLSLQTLTLDRTRRALQSLLELAPREATVRRDGVEIRIPVEVVAIGDEVSVLPGERIPVDGEVISGRSLVDQAPITGESVPVEIEPGSRVFAASINGDGALSIRSTAAAADTTLARIIQQVEEAQGSRAPAQAFVDRFATIYTPIVIGLAVLLATAVPLIVGDWRDWIMRALVLLVVACPCALVISTPVALVAAIGSASRRGILFKGGAAIEALASVKTIAFDKTGTLTLGRPAVSQIITFGNWTQADLLRFAASVERGSSHPIAAGIVAEAQKRSLALPDSANAIGLPGLGASAEIDGQTILVGSPRLFGDRSQAISTELSGPELAGSTVVIVGSESELFGLFALSDPVRAASSGAISHLRNLGLRLVMLTGDNEGTARRIAGSVGVTEYRAALMPADKVSAIQELQRDGGVAMIGDGVNDAPALAVAEVGIAMGAGGTDVAIEAADVALMGDEIEHLPMAVTLARGTMAIIRQNIAAAIAVKIAFLALTFLGVTNLWLAVLADLGMSLLVTGNALRLIRMHGAKPKSTLLQRAGKPAHSGHAH